VAADPYAHLKENAWRELAEIDRRLEQGEIDERGWHAEVGALLVPAYIAAETPWGQSGKSGSGEGWEYSRSLLANAIDRDGTFLDVGCANGFLLIVGVFTEHETERTTTEPLLASGLAIGGKTMRRHRSKPGMECRVLWIDAELP
jgi:hypothetical protein